MSRCSAGSGGVSAREGGDSAASWTARMGRRGSVRARGAGHRREGDRPQRRRTYRGSACQHDQHGRQTRRACVARDDLIENHKVEYACHETAAVPTHHARVDDATVTPLESPWPLVRDASFWHRAFAPTPPDSVNIAFRFYFLDGFWVRNYVALSDGPPHTQRPPAQLPSRQTVPQQGSPRRPQALQNPPRHAVAPLHR